MAIEFEMASEIEFKIINNVIINNVIKVWPYVVCFADGLNVIYNYTSSFVMNNDLTRPPFPHIKQSEARLSVVSLLICIIS